MVEDENGKMTTPFVLVLDRIGGNAGHLNPKPFDEAAAKIGAEGAFLFDDDVQIGDDYDPMSTRRPVTDEVAEIGETIGDGCSVEVAGWRITAVRLGGEHDQEPLPVVEMSEADVTDAMVEAYIIGAGGSPYFAKPEAREFIRAGLLAALRAISA